METETMPTVATPMCPSCKGGMEFQEGGMWRCLSCNPIPMDVPICATQKCKRPLTKLGEPWNCWICLHCNDHPDVINKRMATIKPDRREAKYVDQPMTEERVKEIAGMSAEQIRDIVRETMAEFSTKEEPDPDYPPPRAEINQLVESVLNIEQEEDYDPKKEVAEAEARIEQRTKEIKEKTHKQPWLLRAKELGINTHQPEGGLRKKSDILADIAKVEAKNGGSSDEQS